MLSQDRTDESQASEDLIKPAVQPAALDPKPRRFGRRVLASGGGIAAGLFAAAALLAGPDGFVARTSILLDAQSDAAASSIDARIETLHAPALLRQVVETQHLDTDPEFAAPIPAAMKRAFAWLHLSRPNVPSDAAQATASLAERLSIDHTHGSFIADLAVRADDPTKAKRLVEAIAHLYLEAPRTAARKTVDETVASAGMVDATLPTGSIEPLYRPAARAEEALAEAKGRVADSQARLDQLQRAMASGRNAETAALGLPRGALDGLRLRLVDAAREEAALKTTLGDRHPDLVQSAQRLRDLRRQFDEELKRAVAAAARDHASAEADLSLAEKQASAAAAATEAAARLTPSSLPPPALAAMPVDPTPTGQIIAPTAVLPPATPASPLALPVLAACTIFGLWRLLQSRRKKPVRPPASPRASVEVTPPAPQHAAASAAPATPAETVERRAAAPQASGRALEVATRAAALNEIVLPRPAAGRPGAEPEALPVLGRIPLAQGVARPAPWETRVGGTSGRNAAAALAELVRVSFSPFGTAIVDLYTLLGDAAAEAGLESPWTLLVTTPGDDPGAYAAVAAGLARAAVREGQRTLILEGDVDRQYRRHLVAPQAQPAFIEIDRTPRPIYSLDKEHNGLFLVPACPNPAAFGAVDKARQVTIDAFDFVVVAGSSVEADAGTIVADAADMVLIVGQPETSRRDLAAAAARFGRSKLCAAVLADAPPFIGARGAA